MNPHRASFSRQPLAQLAVVFSAGICIANYLPARLLPWLIAGGVCSALSIAAVLNRRLSVAGFALLVATGCAGATLAVQENRDERRSGLAEFAGRQVMITGVISGPVEAGGDRLYLTLDAERVDVDGFERRVSGIVSLVVALKNEYEGLELRYGARIRVTARLNRGDEFRNPGVSPLSEYLERKGYDATGFVKSTAAITRLDDARGWSVHVLGPLYSWRKALQREIDTRFATETAGVLDAALLGNRYTLSGETSERFREGGTFHVLVISGLHISFIGGLVFLATKRLSRRRWLQIAVPAICVWSYSLAVGAEASVVRAAIMFTFAGLALVLLRESNSLNALGAATLVLLVHRPSEVFDPSFQLTFLSVLAIVVIAWPLLQRCTAIGAWYPSRETPQPPVCSREWRWFCEVLFWSERQWAKQIARTPYRYRLFKTPVAAALERYRIQVCLRYVFAAVVVSGSVQLVLLPLMIIYFHRLSLASLILNIVVSVLLTALTAVALLALILVQLSLTLAAPFIHLANAINWLMVHSVDPFTHFNLASIRVPEYSGCGAFVYVLYFVPLLALVLKKDRVRLAVFAQLLLVLVVVLHPFSNRIDGRLRVDFLDVGQGDAAVITLPDGRVFLIDGGGTTDKHGLKTDRRSIGETVVSEYLWWRGMDTIDYVLATHADADHIDGLNDVLRNFSVDAALVARRPANDPEYARLAQTLAATQTPEATLQAGDMIHFGNITIEVLWPLATAEPNAPSRNNDSIVLRLTYGQRKLLFTGDIEKSAEQTLVESTNDPRAGTPANNLQADVVKVPHHGSKTSSTQPFVAATHAQTAIISVGQYSMFAHPHREVVERWQASGAQVLTTGKCGTITVTTDGTDLTVTGMQSRTSGESPCPSVH
ncbi:MAG TPA: DNA internalization-related competence protein ComEC/Rec2 [Pyrinomonadaceae bacterium]|nr:DNA internalization-related competence protein ComEC/Rec2 [Pyrinomonadaceae bacterium]